MGRFRQTQGPQVFIVDVCHFGSGGIVLMSNILHNSYFIQDIQCSGRLAPFEYCRISSIGVFEV